MGLFRAFCVWPPRRARIDAGVTPVTSLERAGNAEEEDMSVEVHPSGADIGAEIAGIDLSKPLSAAEEL
jgi:hypothetical protein